MLKTTLKKCGELFLSFARVGVLTFGGGLAMLPMLQREIVERRSWADEDELADYFAIGQCTPGIIAVNTATFVGYKQGGALGGVAATFGVVFPSLVIITVIAALLSNFADIPAVQNAFAGVRVCVCVLILNAVVKLWRKSVKGIVGIAIFAIVFIGAAFTDISPVVFVVIAGAAGVIIKGLGERRK